MRLACQAVPAMAAGDMPFAADKVADLETFNIFANLGDLDRKSVV